MAVVTAAILASWETIVAKIENVSNGFLVHEYIVIDTKFVFLSCF